jgi:hypothetical protein
MRFIDIHLRLVLGGNHGAGGAQGKAEKNSIIISLMLMMRKAFRLLGGVPVAAIALPRRLWGGLSVMAA